MVVKAYLELRLWHCLDVEPRSRGQRADVKAPPGLAYSRFQGHVGECLTGVFWLSLILPYATFLVWWDTGTYSLGFRV